MAFAWHDLLGTPWKLHGTDRSGMDCSTVAEEIMRRDGKNPPPTNPFRAMADGERIGEDGVPVPEALAHAAGAYTYLGDDASVATQVGDVVLCKDAGGVARSLYTLVDPSRGTFLTSAHGHGVVVMRRYAMGPVVAVYRLRGTPT